jgi:hypothetical protein
MLQPLAFWLVSSAVTLGAAVWSLRYKRRIQGTARAETYHGVKFGAAYIALFPVSAILFIGAIVILVGTFSRADELSIDEIDNGCESVEIAIGLLSSDDDHRRTTGVLMARKIWDQAAEDDKYQNSLRTECPVEVVEMLESAGIPLLGGT